MKENTGSAKMTAYKYQSGHAYNSKETDEQYDNIQSVVLSEETLKFLRHKAKEEIKALMIEEDAKTGDENSTKLIEAVKNKETVTARDWVGIFADFAYDKEQFLSLIDFVPGNVSDIKALVSEISNFGWDT